MTDPYKELREALEKTAPGEWGITSIRQEDGSIGITCGKFVIAYVTNAVSFFDIIQGAHPEAQFAHAKVIVEARNSLPALLTERDALKAQLEWTERYAQDAIKTGSKDMDDWRGDMEHIANSARAALSQSE